MTKLRQLLRLIRSMATHMPAIPPPMMTTAALVVSLLPTATCGHGLSPAIVK
jgi:hypothetical protein